ncbi:MAG: HutD family protein, partial [Proteobacteria bacterium]|nr:HutD family protein [Pseudomonadota bacterium]
MPPRLLPASARTPKPWKNGGGVTTDVLVWPEGAGLDDFLFRVSIAEVASDGPFSRFVGVDRILTVIGGAGMVLRFNQNRAVTVTPASGPFAFAGDDDCSAELIDGPLTDLNVMSRREHWRADIAFVTEPEAVRIDPDDGHVLVLILVGSAQADRLHLGPRDALHLEPGNPGLTVTPLAGSRCAIIRFRSAAPTARAGAP